MQTCAEVRHKTEAHLADVRTRIDDLRRIEAILSKTAAQCSGDSIPECAILDILQREDESGAAGTPHMIPKPHGHANGGMP